MATAVKIDSVPSTERGVEIIVPLNMLKKSPSNARRVPHGEAAIEALAASMAAKGILQPPVVAPEVDGEGQPTGFYLVTIGEGRRLALLLRAKRKEIRKTEPVRCSLDTANDPGEISLDENVTRSPMHPADEFEAFRRLNEEKGLGAEEIGARFGVSAHVVKQRLRLGAVSPKLLDIYRAGDLTLDQLMAFAITNDHAQQEAVYDRLSWNRDPSIIRRDLTQSNVPATDRRAVFVGVGAYEEAGGGVIRDLFAEDRGGYLADAALLDTLVAEGLNEFAIDLRKSEGWKWIDVSVDFPHGHGFRRVWPETTPLSPEDEARIETASSEHDALCEGYDSYDALPEDVREKIEALEVEIDALSAKRSAFRAEDITRGGVFVTLGHDGQPDIKRGYIRPEDEPPVTPVPEAELEGTPQEGGSGYAPDQARDDDEVGDRPLSDSLIADLSAHRTLGFRVELGERPDLALACVVHALTASLFYPYAGQQSALDIKASSANIASHAQGIGDGASAAALESRHAAWGERLPGDLTDLWAFVTSLDQDGQLDLLAHVASLSVNALVQRYDRRPTALAHAEVLAEALRLDMTVHWRPTANSYFGRVTKGQILEVIRDAVGEAEADRIAPMKKGDMASAAEALVKGKGWLPPALRTRGLSTPDGAVPEAGDPASWDSDPDAAPPSDGVIDIAA